MSTLAKPSIIPRRSFAAPHVVAVFEYIITETGIQPTYVRYNNGPEFTAQTLINCCGNTGIKTAFITPGSPGQDGFIESFNAHFRREQLSQELIETMAEAKYLANEYRRIYNQDRLHGALGGLTPNKAWTSQVNHPDLVLA